jgi:type VI secretion system secreted protein Hcp
MPLPIHLECNAKKQGKINGSCDMAGRESTVLVHGMRHRFFIPHNPQDGLPTSHRKHAPISIVKEVDASTPSLYQALVAGEKFDDVTLKYYKISELGTEDQYYTQTLKNASIVSIRSQSPLSFLEKNEPYGHMEIVSFSYEKIEWSNNTFNIHTEDKKCNSTSPLDDMLNGLEFAFKAVFEIKKHAIKTVAHDVKTSLLNFIPFSPGLGFFIGRAVSVKEIADNYNCSEETIVSLSQRIEKIRKQTMN